MLLAYSNITDPHYIQYLICISGLSKLWLRSLCIVHSFSSLTVLASDLVLCEMDRIRIRPILLVVLLLAFGTPICNGGRLRLQRSLVFHFQHGLHRLEAVYARTESNGHIEYGFKTDELLKGNEENGIAEEEEEEERSYEQQHHPADELLQTNKADGTVSYILGGY